MSNSRRALLATTFTALLAQTAVAAVRTPDFVEDDYDAARAQARQRKVPLLVEVWAPW